MTMVTQKTKPASSKFDLKMRLWQKQQLAHEAAYKLRQAEVFTNIKEPFTWGDDNEAARKTADTLMPLRIRIPLTMHLADRLVRTPVLAISSHKTSFGATQLDYQLTCDSHIGIWHKTADAVQALNNTPLNVSAVRSELPCFVLWAMSAVLPGMYKCLAGSVFGTAQEAACHGSRELPAPIPYDNCEPTFEFRYGNVLGKASMHPTSLVHTFISGATGVGKTYGGVKPLLQSFLAYRNAQGKRMGMLVIDPKSELLQVCTEELGKVEESARLFRPGAGARLQFFRDDCDLCVEERYRTLAGMVQVRTVGEGALWQEKGNRLNIQMAESDRHFQLQTGTNLWGVVRSLLEGRDCTQESQWANILAIYKHAGKSRESLMWTACVSHVLIQLCPDLHRLQSPFAVYTNDSEMLNQLYYRVSNAEKVCSDLASPDVFNVISTDLYPGSDPSACSVEDLLEQGKVMLLQPRPCYFGDIVGRLVKSRFFADVLARRDMTIPVGYVADEFQRFITCDRDTGEQSFLDRCRAYRVNCVLASQSLASIEHALTQSGEASPALAVDIIVANTPTKIIYRSVDSTTQKTLKEWLPPAPAGRMHVADVRPPAQLPIGSAYYLCDGEWGMYRYEKRERTAHTQTG